MNNNYDLIEYFLNMMKEFAISNPDKQITENFVYSNLIRFNINDFQRSFENIENNFENWINRYATNSNINLFTTKTTIF